MKMSVNQTEKNTLAIGIMSEKLEQIQKSMESVDESLSELKDAIIGTASRTGVMSRLAELEKKVQEEKVEREEMFKKIIKIIGFTVVAGSGIWIKESREAILGLLGII